MQQTSRNTRLVINKQNQTSLLGWTARSHRLGLLFYICICLCICRVNLNNRKYTHKKNCMGMRPRRKRQREHTREEWFPWPYRLLWKNGRINNGTKRAVDGLYIKKRARDSLDVVIYLWAAAALILLLWYLPPVRTRRIKRVCLMWGKEKKETTPASRMLLFMGRCHRW